MSSKFEKNVNGANALDSIMRVSISDIMPIIELCDNNKISLCIDGDHGIGKTDIVKQYAKDRGMHIEVLQLSQKDIGDLLGIPNIITNEDGTSHTEWAPPIYFENIINAKKMGKKSVLFLDELNRGHKDVRQASLQLLLDKQLATHILPRDTLVIAAVNPSNGKYQVDELDPALLNRLMYIYAEAEVEGWLQWSRKAGVNEVVRDYIKNNPTKLNDNEKATPRSWATLGKVVDNIDTLPVKLQLPAISGCIGTVGVNFYNFLINYVKEIKIDDIINVAQTLLLGYTGDNIDKRFVDVGPLLYDEIVHKMEGIAQVDAANTLKDIVLKDKTCSSVKAEDCEVILAYLHSLKLETLNSILRSWKDTSETSEFFYTIMKHDPNKELMIKIRVIAQKATS